jgi:hypothetical protein
MEAAARFPLRQPGSKLLLGSLLVRDGLVEMQQVEDALAEQERTDRRLGEILVERALISDCDLAQAVTEQHGQAGNRLCLEGTSSHDEIRRVTGDRVR